MKIYLKDLRKLMLFALFFFWVQFSYAQKPNIIVVVVDDAGYADWGFQNSSLIETPNIDLLKDEGTYFSQAYVTNSVCAPSRAGILTGRYQNRFGFEYNIVNYYPAPGKTAQDVGLNVNELTIADRLKPLGYATAAIGKWHEGEKNRFHPCNRGFDYFYGLLDGSRPYFHTSNLPSGKKLMRNFDVDDLTSGYITDIFTNDAINWIQQQVDSDKPFFTYLSYTAVHGPYESKQADLDRFSDCSSCSADRKNYAAMTYSLDENIGKLFDSLKSMNVYDNTLILFINDNGGPHAGTITDNGVLRDGKSSQYEGGLRVPFLISWPGHVPAGGIYDKQVISLDILPTILSAAGAPVPTDKLKLDGVNLLPVMNNTTLTTHEYLYFRKLYQWSVVKKEDQKLIVNYNETVDSDNDTLLYDLSNDISETTNLFTTSSDPVAQELIAKYNEWEREMILPYWISDFVSDKVCGNGVTNTDDCSFLQSEYAQKTYYVSSSTGDDATDGLTEATAWKTLDKVSNANIEPGVSILFKAGDTFVGQLKPNYSGTLYEPIVFGKYGSGNNPVLDGATTNGAYTATVLINNQEYIELQDLEITNDSPVCLPGEDEKAAYGIWVLNDTTVKEVMHHFHFKRLTIKNIFAQNTSGIDFNDLTVAGIYFKTEKNYVAGQEKNIQDVLVDSCYITRTGKFGIWTQHKGSADASIGNDSINRNMNLVFTNNHTYETGGSGLTPGKSYNVLVENNIFEKTGSGVDSRMANRGSGAWFYNCRNVLVQHNKSLHARGDGDSYGMHIDHSNKNVFLQYNYSEDASGGFIEILGNNVNSVYRYNISVNDGLRAGARTIWVTQYPSNLPKSDLNYIYGNTIYVKDGLTPDIKIEGKNTYVFNNSFQVAGNGKIGNVVDINTAANAELVIDNNLFYGNISNAFKNLDNNPVNDNPKYFMPGALDENGYKLLEGSAALNAGRLISEPVFPKAGQGIFANISATVDKDYFGNPVDLVNQVPHIGAYNGTALEGSSSYYEAEDATLLGTAATTSCSSASGGIMVNNIGSGGEVNAVSFDNILATTGQYELTFSYISKTGRDISYKINGGTTQTVSIPGNGAYCYEGGSPIDYKVTTNLQDGINTILVFDGPILDKIKLIEMGAVIFEAEDAVLSGTSTIASCTTSSNGEMVKLVNNGAANTVTFDNVEVAGTADYPVSISYFADSQHNISVSVNGGTAQTISVPATGSWCYQGGSPGTFSFTLSLSEGVNSIAIYDVGIIDKIEVSGAIEPTISNPTDYEAEDATLIGTATIATCNTTSGGKMVKKLTGGSANAVNFNNVNVDQSGDYSVTLQYFSKSGVSMSVSVNSGTTEQITLPATGKWCYEGGSPGTFDITLALNSGVNSIVIYDISVLDKITVSGMPVGLKVLSAKDDLSVNNHEITLFPNPTSSTLNIEIIAKNDGQVNIKLMDLTGKTIMNKQTSVCKGQNILQYNIGNMVKEGVYFINIEINGIPYIKRVLIQK